MGMDKLLPEVRQIPFNKKAASCETALLEKLKNSGLLHAGESGL
jgi:hypothetical protein